MFMTLCAKQSLLKTFLLLERLAYGTCIKESNFCPIATVKDLLTIVEWSDKLVRLG